MCDASRRLSVPAWFALGVVVLTTMALGSCYPGDQLTVSEADVVVTLFDPDADFAAKQSYALPDSVIHLVSDGGTNDISRDFDAQILAQVVSNMGALGFTREGDPADADVILLVAISVREQIGYTGNPWGGYWGWYYPYSPGWGWGYYPWYGGGGTVYTYRTGTLFMDMIDPAAADSTLEQVPTIWIGALNGIVDGDAVEERIIDGINQVFAQSPYLGEGK